MKPVGKYINKYMVMSRDVDFTKKLKMSSAFNYFEDIAALHADNLGYGIETLMEDHGVIWVITRIKVDITRYPLLNEEVVLETWPQTPKRYQFERDYLLKDKEGNILIQSLSTWVILDFKTREMRKSEMINVQLPEIIEQRAISCNLGQLKAFGKPEIVYKRMVGCSDIDMNGHLNNTRYIDYIMDCFSYDELKSYQAKSIQVNYVSEALPGEIIILYKDSNPSDPRNIYIEGINEKTGGTIFRALLDIQETGE